MMGLKRCDIDGTGFVAGGADSDHEISSSSSSEEEKKIKEEDEESEEDEAFEKRQGAF
jgi:hypothetical protein